MFSTSLVPLHHLQGVNILLKKRDLLDKVQCKSEPQQLKINKINCKIGPNQTESTGLSGVKTTL